MIRHDGIAIDRASRTISHRGVTVSFHYKSGFRLLETLILAGPKNRFEIFDLVYRDCRGGGPADQADLISVWLTQLRARGTLDKLQLELKKDKDCRRFMRYQLVPRELASRASPQRLQAALE